jgi:uncharacterized protein YjeT (DUF2065 family)
VWNDLFSALALVLVIEGIMPFVAPDKWKHMLTQVMQFDDRTLRIFGGVLMVTGLVILYSINR